MHRVILTPSLVIGLGLSYGILIFAVSAYWPDKSSAAFTLTLVTSLAMYVFDRDIFTDSESPILVALFGIVGGLSFISVDFTSPQMHQSIGNLSAVGISISVLYVAYKARFPKREIQNARAANQSGPIWTIFLEGDENGGIIYKKNLTLDEAVDALAELNGKGKRHMRAYAIIDGSQVYAELKPVVKISDKGRDVLPYNG